MKKIFVKQLIIILKYFTFTPEKCWNPEISSDDYLRVEIFAVERFPQSRGLHTFEWFFSQEPRKEWGFFDFKTKQNKTKKDFLSCKDQQCNYFKQYISKYIIVFLLIAWAVRKFLKPFLVVENLIWNFWNQEKFISSSYIESSCSYI